MTNEYESRQPMPSACGAAILTTVVRSRAGRRRAPKEPGRISEMRVNLISSMGCVLVLGVGSIAQAQVSVGVVIGRKAPPPVVVQEPAPVIVEEDVEPEPVVIEAPPPPRVYRVAPRPGPEFMWVEGYWYPQGRHYLWRDGYWTRPPYFGAYWVAPYYHRGVYVAGYWGGGRGRHDRDRRERERDRDRRESR